MSSAIRAVAVRVTTDSLACASAHLTSRSSTASSASARAFSALEALAVAAEVASAAVVCVAGVPADVCDAAPALNVACTLPPINRRGARGYSILASVCRLTTYKTFDCRDAA